MFTRIKHTSQGFILGSMITIAACAALYPHTHDIKFTATASNQPAEIVQAENDAVGVEKLTPPADKKVVTVGDIAKKDWFIKAATPVPGRNPFYKAQ